MKVLAFKVGKQPEIIEIENTLEDLQKFVGGYIEVFNVDNSLTIICNDEGKLMKLPFNRYLPNGDYIVGDFLAVSTKNSEFIDLKEQDEALAREMFEKDEITNSFTKWLNTF